MFIITYIELLALSLIQDSIIFKPNPKDMKPIKAPVEYGLVGTEDKVLTTDDNQQIHYWIKKPASEDKPYIVFFQGNTGHLGDVGAAEDPEKVDLDYKRDYRINILKTIEDEGYGFIALSPRGFGKSTGKPSEAGYIKDVKALAQLVKKDNLKTIVFGESLGAFSALTLMRELEDSVNQPMEVALIGAFSSLEDKAYETHPEFKRFDVKRFLKYRFDNIKILSETKYKGRILLIHSLKDKTTGAYQGEFLLSEGRKKGLDIKLVILKNSGHINWDPKTVMNDILENLK